MVKLILLIFFILPAGCNASGGGGEGERKTETLSSISLPLERESSTDALLKEMGEADFVLLGEASHGTSEFYLKRSLISRRLIKEKDFSLVAVEGDWTAVNEINRYVKGIEHQHLNAEELLLKTFQRWPEWMWGNREFALFLDWLREYNRDLEPEDKRGIYGLDIYGFARSIDLVASYIEKVDPQKGLKARNLYRDFKRLAQDQGAYIREVMQTGSHQGDNLRKVKEIIKENRESYIKNSSPKQYFNALRNSRIVISAEAFYRKMIHRDERSWNARAENFARTAEELLEFYPEAKLIGWAHNTHMGDARATEMSITNQKNMGQMLRENHPGRVFILGFGTYKGRVAAGRAWGEDIEIMTVPESPAGTAEYIMNEASQGEDILFFSRDLGEIPELNRPLGHRAIGVVYNPETEYPGNYVNTILPARYDAFIFFPRTEAVTPLEP